MNHLFKRTLSLLLALAMVFTMLPGIGIHAHAEELEILPQETYAEEEIVETEPIETPASTETEEVIEETEDIPEETEDIIEETEDVIEETEDDVEETEDIVEETEDVIPEETEEIIYMDDLSASADAAMAAISGLTDPSIGLEGESAWTANGNTISGSVTGSKLFSYYISASSTLTIKNTKSVPATLSFTFTASGNFKVGSSVTVDGTEYTSAVTNKAFTKELAAGGSITIKLSADRCNASNGANTISISIKDLLLTSDAVCTTTFQAPDYGKYTVSYGSNTVTINAGDAPKAIENAADVIYTMKAVPGEGYKLLGWQNVATGAYLSMQESYIANFDTSTTVKPVIMAAATPVFQVGTQYYFDLDDAVKATTSSLKQITLISDGTISDAAYEIPSGITLLIPFDTSYKLYGSDPQTDSIPDSTSAPTAKVFSKLTLAPNTVITVKGAIEVGAKHYASHGGKTIGGTPVGGYGQIIMGSNSAIVLENNAKLYAWGYITGSGSVTAKSGSTVYEKMQVSDYRGGNRTDTVVREGVFPFNQYFIQNVEVPETIMSGATLVCHAGIYAYWVQEQTVDFMNNSDAMFALSAGASVTKRYDATADRLILDVQGNVAMNPITLMGENTEEFILPFNHNITVNIKSGASATVNQDIMMQPGAAMNVENGGTLTLKSGKKVYLMDAASWGTFCFGAKMRPVTFVGSRGGAPVSRALTDASMNIDGNLVLGGQLYAASSAVKITSTGKSGKISFDSAAPAATTVKQCISSGENTMQYKDVAVAAPYLTNGNKSTINTNGVPQYTVYNYCSTHDCWYTGSCHYTIKWEVNGKIVETDAVKSGEKLEFNGAHPADLPGDAQYEAYMFDGWDFDGDGVADEALPNVTGDATYKAVYVPGAVKKYNVVFKDSEGTLYTAENVPYGSKPSYEGVMQKNVNCTVYTISIPEVKAVDGTEATLSYTVTWTAGEIEHTGEIRYENKGDTHSAAWTCCGTSVETNEAHTYDQEDGNCICGAEEPKPAGMKGDVDLDGDVDAEDLTVLAQQIAGIIELEGQAAENADVDSSGDVSADDLTVHATYIAGNITEWP